MSRAPQAPLFTYDGAATVLVSAGEPRLRTFRSRSARVAPISFALPLLRRARRLATS